MEGRESGRESERGREGLEQSCNFYPVAQLVRGFEKCND
jgi:hypothetical protein